MPHDIEQLLHRIVAAPSQPVDVNQIVGRGRRRRRWRQGLVAASGLAAMALAVLVVVPGSERPTVQFDPPPPRTDLTGEEWEVMTVDVTIIAGSRVAATQQELDEAWAWFEMEGPAPVLPAGQGALIGSVAGTCNDPSQVLGLGRVPADSPAGIVGEFAVMHVDADCAFIDRFGTASRSPRTLYVIGVAVESMDTLVSLVAVSAPVAGLEWQLLTVVPGVSASAIGVGQADQAMLDWAWAAWEVGEETPELPDGWSAFAAAVPGTCTDPSHLRGVQALGYLYEDGFATIGLAAKFDPTCAEVDTGSGQPRSLYVIIVPTNVAGTLHGPWEYITCEEADDIGSCQGADRELIHTKW